MDLQPAFVAGHSVGEYAALVAAGVLAAPDAIRLVARRGELMGAADVDGGMAAVIGLDRDAVADAIAAVAGPADLVVANDNAPGQVVISGTRAALTDAAAALREAGARRVIPLPVSGPFHSPWMAEVSDALAAAFDEVEWSDATLPVVSNVTAEPVTDAERSGTCWPSRCARRSNGSPGAAHGGRRRRHLHRVRAGCGPDRHGEAHRA